MGGDIEEGQASKSICVQSKANGETQVDGRTEVRAKAEACRARARRPLTVTQVCGKGAWVTNGAWTKSEEYASAAGIEIDESQSGGIEVWETGQ